jgi:DNA polymerase-3 subunit delta
MAQRPYSKAKRKGGSAAVRLGDFMKTAGGAPPRSVYVLRGTDPYLLNQARTTIRAQVLGDADPDLALLEATGADAVLADVLGALRTLPFLAPRRLVVVREADPFVAAAREALERYLEAPSPTGSLCLEVAEWNETTRLARRVADPGVGALIACEVVPELLPTWLQRQARKVYAKQLTRAGVELLIESLGHDMAPLLAAVEALALYAGDAPAIDAREVDALVARGNHEQIWALCEAVAQRRAPRALELLDAFQADGMEAPQLIGLLRKEFRNFLHVRALARRMSIDAAMNQAGVKFPAFARTRAAVASFSDEHLADAYQALVDADLDSKSGADPRLAMEGLVHRLCDPDAARRAGPMVRASAE